jgi:hypothetical protein
MISKVTAILSQELPANIFCADCELDHIHRRNTGAMCPHRMARANLNVRRLARSLGVILRWRPCFFALGSLAAVPPHSPRESRGVPVIGVKKRPRRKNTPRPLEIFPAVTVRNFNRPNRTSFQPLKAASSAADLDRVNVPSGARMHALPHRVAAAIVVIGIAVGVVRIAVVVVVAVVIGVWQQSRRERCTKRS